eukprot:gb/GFBE01037262.1/.p1 GENE.gb/GFBE01037262.1/~~gb/GFBE01037262.1/.p1  ORF type:complete len:646 (+),score=146.02 gb/GFBE01037262.1/:1-1938(+)
MVALKSSKTGGLFTNVKDGLKRKTWEKLPPSAQEAAYRAVDKFWKHTGSEASNARVLFRRHASGKNENGERVMTLPESNAMIEELCETLDIPQDFFFDLPTQFRQFDFSGDGKLNREEAVTMVKNILKQRRQGYGGELEDEEDLVPHYTLEDGGYTVTRELGRGGQGVMYLADKEIGAMGFLNCTGANDAKLEYCIKFYSKKDANAGGVKELVEEFSRMKDFDNKYVAKTFEVFQDQAFYYLVNEPYFGGDWTKLVKKAHSRGARMSEDWWRKLFKQCLEGLDYLHRAAQMHCDIKEPNLMTRKDDDFSSPQVVFIDFGLAQGFVGKTEGISGTPGYIPPETWQDKAWYPRGDIFSLGVVFFQMLSGNVPSSDGTKKGIFQEGAKDLMDVGRVTSQAQPPWQQFPLQWRELSSMVASMLQKQEYARPRAIQVLEDPWFSSGSDAELPREILGRMVSGSSQAFARNSLIDQLCEECNLRELRSLRAYLDQEANAYRAYGVQPGMVPAESFVAAMAEFGVDAQTTQECLPYIQAAGGRLVVYGSLMDEVLKEKELRSRQLVTNLFNEMDDDEDGCLSHDEIRAMLESDHFECDYEDVDEVLRTMDVNHDGVVELSELTRAIMNDGRIACKDAADRGERPAKRWFGWF